MPAPLFEIDDLWISGGDAPGAEAVRGVSLAVNAGELHALVGPIGSGLPTVGPALFGSPHHSVSSGRILLRGDDITTWPTDVRAKAGLFLAFPNPEEISGVSILTVLRQALNARRGMETTVPELQAEITSWADKLGINGSNLAEKQLGEILQMAVLEPEMAVLDESGGGLDAEGRQDAEGRETVSRALHSVRADRPALGTLAITHNPQLLDNLRPDVVHVLIDGQIVATGGAELGETLLTTGYESFR